MARKNIKSQNNSKLDQPSAGAIIPNTYIERDPNILGGAAVVIGTRVPVSRILFLLKEGYTPELIHKYEYPFIGLATIQGTISQLATSLDKTIDEKTSTLHAAS